MDRKDLRIGDTVLYKENPVIIREINGFGRIEIGGIKKVGCYELRPIPITEELLSEMRFIDNQLTTNKGWIGTELFGDGDWWFTLRDAEGQYLAEIKVNYLHQLQHIMWDFLHQEV